MKLPDRVYDVLKWVGLVALPWTAWLIGEVGPAWGMANVDAIVLTLVKTGAFLGALIGVSTVNYNKTV